MANVGTVWEFGTGAYVDVLPLRKTIPPSRGTAEFFLEPVHLHREPCALQTVPVISRVETYMVMLAKSLLSFFCAWEGWVFVCLLKGLRNRDLENGPTAGGEDAQQFRHRPPVVRDMLQHVIADDSIKTHAPEGHVRDV